MKKLLTSFFIACCCLAPSVAQAISNGAVNSEQSTYVTDSSNTTVILLSAVTGTKYTVYGYDLSISTADTITLQCGSTAFMSYYLAATSGVVRTYYPLWIQCASGSAVQLVKGTSTTPVNILLFYSSAN